MSPILFLNHGVVILIAGAFGSNIGYFGPGYGTLSPFDAGIGPRIRGRSYLAELWENVGAVTFKLTLVHSPALAVPMGRNDFFSQFTINGHLYRMNDAISFSSAVNSMSAEWTATTGLANGGGYVVHFS